MTDPEWLLRELDRWGDPSHTSPAQARLREALESAAHQRLASRLQAALAAAPSRAVDGLLPPP